MKNLYFLFAIIALPLAAFAEPGDTTVDQTSLKQPVTTTPTAQQKDQKKTVKKVKMQKGEKRFEKERMDKDGDIDSRATQ